MVYNSQIKIMRALLISANTEKINMPTLPLGLACVAAATQKAGHEVAIVDSMTVKERHNPRLINGSRRLRIAKGSGTTVQDVNRLLKQFAMMKKMIKQFTARGSRGISPGMLPM